MTTRLERWWRYALPWHVGRLVRIRGSARVGRCRFDVSDPRFTQFLAGQFALGRYERIERQAVAKFLDPALPVVECGGSIGVVACVTNRRLSHPDQHVVIEADPSLMPLLVRNRNLNGCRFSVVHGAVGCGDEPAWFNEPDWGVVAGTAAPVQMPKAIRVPGTTIKAQLAARGWSRCTLICDIEGAEARLFEDEADLIARTMQTIILETHRDASGVDTLDAIKAALLARGFDHAWANGDVHVFRHG